MPINPGVLGTQYVALPMTVGVALANAVFTVQTPWSSKIFPYLGVGAGVARLSIQGANSTNPSEPGINHFDSGPDASATAFALQFKAGVKGEVAKNLLLFAEYRSSPSIPRSTRSAKRFPLTCRRIPGRRVWGASPTT